MLNLKNNFYHGSNQNFSRFDIDKTKQNRLGYAINLTQSKDVASSYGNYLYECQLIGVRKIIKQNEMDKLFPKEIYWDYALTLQPDRKKLERLLVNYDDIGLTYHDAYDQSKDDKNFFKALEKHGYDGIWMEDDQVLGIFNPSKVKILSRTKNF